MPIISVIVVRDLAMVGRRYALTDALCHTPLILGSRDIYFYIYCHLAFKISEWNQRAQGFGCYDFFFLTVYDVFVSIHRQFLQCLCCFPSEPD